MGTRHRFGHGLFVAEIIGSGRVGGGPVDAPHPATTELYRVMVERLRALGPVVGFDFVGDTVWAIGVQAGLHKNCGLIVDALQGADWDGSYARDAADTVMRVVWPNLQLVDVPEPWWCGPLGTLCDRVLRVQPWIRPI